MNNRRAAVRTMIQIPPFCSIRPDQDPASYEISWSAKLIVRKHETMLKTDDKRISKKDTFSLHMRGLRVDDAGVYTCYKNDLASWAYKVDILPTELREIVSNLPFKIAGMQYSVVTRWLRQ